MEGGNADRLDLALRLLAPHTKANLEALLTAHDLPKPGTKEELIGRLRDAALQGDIPLPEIIRQLDIVEENGQQHVFLYQASETLTGLELPQLVELATSKGHAGLIRGPTRLLNMPAEPTLVGIRMMEDELTVKWVERREWRDRLDDEIQGDLLLVRYRIHEGRAVNLFRANIGAGTSELRISTVGIGTTNRRDYARLESEYHERLSWLFDPDSLQAVELWRAIPRIIHSGETRNRGHRVHTASGTSASFISDEIQTDLFQDPVYVAAEAEASGRSDHRYLNAYWLPKKSGPLRTDVHTYIYADRWGNEVVFPAGVSYDEAKYVLSRVRRFASP